MRYRYLAVAGLLTLATIGCVAPVDNDGPLDTENVYMCCAWFENEVDNDGDGYPSEFDLVYDPDVSGGGTETIYVELYGRVTGTSTWNYITASNNITITGTSSTTYSFSLVGGSHGSHDFLLEIHDASTDALLDSYGPSDDSDLGGHLEEQQSEDLLSTFDAYIYNASFQNEVDNDGDNYPSEFELHFDPDVSSGSSGIVYVELYGRVDGTTAWNFISTSNNLSISGTTTDDYYFDLVGGSRGYHDFLLELYDASTDELLDSYGPSDDDDLDNHMEEQQSEDVADNVYIYNAWFENEVDNDLDTYPSEFELHFDPDVSNSGSATIYVELYGRITGETTWNLITTSTDISISGVSTDDYFFDLVGGSHGQHDFLLEVYDASTDQLLDSYGPSDDSDLAGHYEEQVSED